MNKAQKCSECGGLAVLYTYPHQYAGIWECQNPDCGASDSHTCQSFETDTVSQSYWSPDLEDTIDVEVPVQVCTECGVAEESSHA